jgi:hypothetical protein
MSNTEETIPAGKDGQYDFTMQYGGRELNCHVEKNHEKLSVHIDNNISAELEIHWDGTISQIGGTTLPESNIEFIKKQVMGHKQ